jgi:hypothetical protein
MTPDAEKTKGLAAGWWVTLLVLFGGMLLIWQLA